MLISRYFIKPHNSITDPVEQGRAGLLSSLLIARAIAFIGVLYYLIIVEVPGASGLVSAALALNFLAYGISRTRHYKIGAMIVILESLVMIPTMVAKIVSLEVLAVVPTWLVLGPMLSSLVLTSRATLLTTIGTAVALTFIGFISDRSMLSMTSGTIFFVLATSIIMLLGAYLREKTDQLLQQERAKVIQVSKLSALGEMAGGVAHEINTPLAAIMLNAEMIESAEGLDPDVLQRAKNIVNISERISKIILGLRGFSRDAHADVDKLFTVKELIEYTTDLCNEKFKNNAVRLTVAEANLQLHLKGQIIQLSQCLLNLLNNSYDAIQKLEERWIEIRTVANPGEIEIWVTDSGKGLSPEVVDKIFHPFFTTKEIGKGTGLGLSISRGIIQQHKGDLYYDSKSNNTSFVIRLPMAESLEKAA